MMYEKKRELSADGAFMGHLNLSHTHVHRQTHPLCTVYSHQPLGSRELWLLSSKSTPSCTLPVFFTQLSLRNKEGRGDVKIRKLEHHSFDSPTTSWCTTVWKTEQSVDTTICDSLWGLTKTLSRRQLRLPFSSVMEAAGQELNTLNTLATLFHLKKASRDLISGCMITDWKDWQRSLLNNEIMMIPPSLETKHFYCTWTFSLFHFHILRHVQTI